MDRVNSATTRLTEAQVRDSAEQYDQSAPGFSNRLLTASNQTDRLMAITTNEERLAQHSSYHAAPAAAGEQSSTPAGQWPAPAFFDGFGGLSSSSNQNAFVFSGFNAGIPSLFVNNFSWSDSGSNRELNATLNESGGTLYQRLTVTDESVSWPDDGDYMVFDHVTQDVVAYGESAATLEPGLYAVFNVTTGERSDIAIGDIAGQSAMARNGSSDDGEQPDRFVGPQSGITQNDDGSVTVTVTHGPGHHEVTFTPAESWSETLVDAGVAAGWGAFGAGVFLGAPTPVVVAAAAGSAGHSISENVDAEHEWHPPAWLTWLADVVTDLFTTEPVSAIVHPEGTSNDSSDFQPTTVNGASKGEWAGARDEEGEPVNSMAAEAEEDFNNAQPETSTGQTATTDRPSNSQASSSSGGGWNDGDGWSGDDSGSGAGQNSNSDTDGIGP